MAYPNPFSAYPTALQALATAHPTICQRVTVNPTTGRTHEGRDLFALKIDVAGRPPDAPSVLVVSGFHAREWAPPDAVLSFAEALVAAFAASRPLRLRRFVDTDPTPDIVYPEIVLPWPEVRTIVRNLKIFILPMANPDGRNHTQAGGVPFWRKNRRPSTATCPPPSPPLPPRFAGTESPIGVDPNRNFGIHPATAPENQNVLWNFEEYYSTTGQRDAGVSKDPCDVAQTFIGPQAGSEPEAQAIQQLITTEQVRWLFDVHSYRRLVLFPWSSEINGSDATKSFKETAWNRSGARGGRDGRGTAYDEFVPDSPEPLRTNLPIYAASIKRAVLRCGGSGAGADARAVRRSTYDVGQPIDPALGLYAVTGSSVDFAFSRQFVTGGWGPIYAFALECGSQHDGEGGFQPPVRIYPKIEREVHAAIFEFLKLAANHAAGRRAAPPTPAVSPPSTPPRTGGSDTCFLAVISLGTILEPILDTVRAMRDQILARGRLGGLLMTFVHRAYYRISPPLARILGRRPIARRLLRWTVAAPVLASLAACARFTEAAADPRRRARLIR